MQLAGSVVICFVITLLLSKDRILELNSFDILFLDQENTIILSFIFEAYFGCLDEINS